MSRLIFAVLVGICLAASLCVVSAVDAASRHSSLMMRMQADVVRAGVEPLDLAPIVNKQCLPSSIIKTQCADDDKCNPEDLLSPGAKLALHQANEDDIEDKQKIAIKECLARQIDSHMQQLGNVNAVASAVRSRYLNLQTEKNIIQEKLRAARDRLFTVEAKEREELSDLQRREAKAAFEAHTRAMAEEEKEKKAVVEQFQKSKELAKQRAQQEREQEEVSKKDASEQKTKLAEQTEKANTRLVEEKVKKMLAQKETINESSHQALQAALAGALPAQAAQAAQAAAAAAPAQQAITDPVTAKLVPGTGLLNPSETNPKIVDSLGAVGDNQVASKPHKDESVTANADDDDDDDDEESSGKGQIVVHIGENGVTVGTEEHAAKEHSEESSEASKEHAEESSEESSIHEAAAEIAAADEAAARELSEAAAPEHATEESTEASAAALSASL